MQGSLCLRNGILYVGHHAKTAFVQGYDLDGHRLGRGFAFRARPESGVDRAAAAGIAADEEHRIWVADTPSASVRAFSLFGREVATFGGGPEEAEDRPGHVGAVIDVATPQPTGASEGRGDEEESAELCVASAGRRRHALQVFDTEGGLRVSLRPRGDPQAVFEDLCGIDWRGRFLYACERLAGRIQVFRDEDFHFLFAVPAARGVRFQPTAVAVLSDGRAVVCQGGERSSALLLVDGAGELLEVLAPHGRDGGEVFEPSDVVVEEGADDRHTRVIVLDCDADRVQVFNLAGRCYGSFRDRPYVTL